MVGGTPLYAIYRRVPANARGTLSPLHNRISHRSVCLPREGVEGDESGRIDPGFSPRRRHWNSRNTPSTRMQYRSAAPPRTALTFAACTLTAPSHSAAPSERGERGERAERREWSRIRQEEARPLHCLRRAMCDRRRRLLRRTLTTTIDQPHASTAPRARCHSLRFRSFRSRTCRKLWFETRESERARGALFHMALRKLATRPVNDSKCCRTGKMSRFVLRLLTICSFSDRLNVSIEIKTTV